jgi:NAD(P)-dependent dehydrogenase (short-subunit alcohol dehydrogenase family)
MRIVIITGGSRGIGSATARACAARGMGVILTYNSNPDSANDGVAGAIASLLSDDNRWINA